MTANELKVLRANVEQRSNWQRRRLRRRRRPRHALVSRPPARSLNEPLPRQSICCRRRLVMRRLPVGIEKTVVLPQREFYASKTRTRSRGGFYLTGLSVRLRP